MTRPPKRNHLLHLLELNPAKAYLEQYINRVEHNPMTADDKRAELEVEGYEFGEGQLTYTFENSPKTGGTVNFVRKQGFFLTGSLNYVTDRAYAHLQAQRKLVALEAENTVLRAFVLDVEYTGARPHLTQQARDLVERYNITADESDEHE